jgi:futalosine hydrolase
MEYSNPEKNKLEKKNIIGMISAVPFEGGLFVKKLKLLRGGISGQPAVYLGRAFDHALIYAISGIGKTNAAHSATILIHKYRPAIVMNFGIGGAYPSSGLDVGEIAIASKEVYADEGVGLKDGFHTLETVGIPLLRKGGRRYFNEFPLDKSLSLAAFSASRSLFNSKRGTFSTVSTCTGTAIRASELAGRFRAICENMEGAAVAHICCLYGIPCVEIRSISNIAGERDTSKWDVRLASENCQEAVIAFLEERLKNGIYTQ